MDPVANIRKQVEVARRILREPDQDRRLSDADRLAELVLALDDWRKHGGFDPYTAR